MAPIERHDDAEREGALPPGREGSLPAFVHVLMGTGLALGVACVDLPPPLELDEPQGHGGTGGSAGASNGGGGSSGDGGSAGGGAQGAAGGSGGQGLAGGSGGQPVCAFKDETGCRTIVQLETGGAFSCARLDNDDVFCWGFNSSGQMGIDPETTDSVPAPIRIGDLGPARDLSTGKHHACALVAQEVKCWGRNTVGQLGIGAASPWETPTVASIDQVSSIHVGSRTSCAVRTDGELYCWGFRHSGQEWNGDDAGDFDAIPVAQTAFAGLELEDVGVGSSWKCVLLNDGALRCAGGNQGGQLGDGTGETSLVPVIPSSLATPVVDLGAGPDHICTVGSGGLLQCWGLFFPETYLAPTAFEPTHPAPIVDSCTGWRHACVLHDDGAVSCWGENYAGQLGNGGATMVPRVVENLAPAQSLACGFEHNCAIDDEQTVWCWGANNHGQLGNGSIGGTAITATPVAWHQ